MPSRRQRLSDRQIDRLLSGDDRLSGPEKDAHLESVLSSCARQGTTARGAPRALRWALAGSSAALLVCLGSLVLLRDEPVSEFSARGGETVPGFSLACPGGKGGACAPGAKLAFRVTAPGPHRFFAALAERGDGVAIWYFPAQASKTSVSLDGVGVDGVLSEGVLLGPEHPAGRYRVWGVFSPTPVDRARIRAALEAGPAGADSELQIVERRFEVTGR